MLYNVFTNILAVIFVLGIMILIHELGHFLAAKYFGIRVYVFSFGFGPRLFGFKHRGYGLSGLCLAARGLRQDGWRAGHGRDHRQ